MLIAFLLALLSGPQQLSAIGDDVYEFDMAGKFTFET